MPLKEVAPSSGDVWTFRLFAGVVAFGLVFAGARFGGRWLHQQEAWTKAHTERPPGEAGRREAGLDLANGYRDTPEYAEFRTSLSSEEQNAATALPHPVEKHGPLAAGIAAMLAILGSGGAGRNWALKRAAQRALRR